MFADFDKAFHKIKAELVPQDCPCIRCDEPKYLMDNPYYHSDKCGDCSEYHQWKSDHEGA